MSWLQMLLTSAAVMSPSKSRSTTSRCPCISACKGTCGQSRTRHRGVLHAALLAIRGAVVAGLPLEPTLFWRSFFSAASCRRAVNRAVITARWAARSSSVMLALRAYRVGINLWCYTMIKRTGLARSCHSGVLSLKRSGPTHDAAPSTKHIQQSAPAPQRAESPTQLPFVPSPQLSVELSLPAVCTGNMTGP